MIREKSFFLLSAALLISSYTFSCGGRDDRDEVRANNGEPDEILTLGKDEFWRETWFYYNAITIGGEPAGLAYEFRKSSGCGVIEDVYLYTQYPVANPDSVGTLMPKILPPTKNRNPIAPY